MKKHKDSHLNSLKNVEARALGLVPMFPKLNFTVHMGLFKIYKSQIWAWIKVKIDQRGSEMHKGCIKNSRRPIETAVAQKPFELQRWDWF